MQYVSLLDTDKAKKSNLSKSLVFALFGLYLIGYSCYGIYAHIKLATCATAFVMGAFLVFAANFSKRCFIAREGIVRTIHSWSGRTDTLMSWQEISLISLVTDGEKLTAYFDNGEIVWKLEFESWQNKDIKQLIKKYAAETDINEIRK